MLIFPADDVGAENQHREYSPQERAKRPATRRRSSAMFNLSVQ
jgi:hypothetical protein